MDKIKIWLPGKRENVNVNIIKKNMKNVRLKVYPSGEVVVSMPKKVSLDWINQYLKEKSKWIEQKIDIFKKTVSWETIGYVKSGITMRIIGEQLRIIIREAEEKGIKKEDDILYIYTKDKNNRKSINRELEKWIREESNKLYEKLLDKLYPIIKKYDYKRPSIHIRKMKTRWGSSNKNKGQIILNYYLYKASSPYIEYVILHELVHFLYPRHNRDFYNFLSIHMPDWKKRKRVLDHEIVKEI